MLSVFNWRRKYLSLHHIINSGFEYSESVEHLNIEEEMGKGKGKGKGQRDKEGG